ncbi:MAG TPA: cbb3-type cytochrome c oxidase N-terminal domain-containing protein [Puia sp.]|nr:cbb3-type cytochrome c oxidase N-terminal domain-containing protein [Puia sp.]
MVSFINKLITKTKSSRAAMLFAAFLFTNVKPVWAEGPPAKSSMSNPLVIIMVAFMIVLLIIIAVLSNMLLNTAQWKFKKWKDEQQKNTVIQAAAIIAGLLFLCNPIFAQTTGGATSASAATTTTNIAAGISENTFYLMAAIIFFELIVVLALLINVRGLLKAEKEKALAGEAAVAKKKTLNWWDKFNKFRPAEQEADIDLGHDYDGIRELDNRLPPWWLWGFYITIVFGAVYLYRYHVAHSAPLSAEEYTISVARADQEVKEYLKQKGETVDENTVTMLGKDDIETGKTFFETSCVTCHNKGGGGNVGPNLTDDYWLHGGDIKSVFKTIKYGFNAMPSWQNTYSNKQIAELASYVKSLHGTNPANPKAPQGELYKEDAAKTDSTAISKKDSVSAAK